MRLLAAFFAQSVPPAHMNRRVALQIRQRKVYPAVAAVSSAQQTEERLVLINLQQLTIATVINLVRILAWSESQPIAKTRTSRFAALVVY